MFSPSYWYVYISLRPHPNIIGSGHPYGYSLCNVEPTSIITIATESPVIYNLMQKKRLVTLILPTEANVIDDAIRRVLLLPTNILCKENTIFFALIGQIPCNRSEPYHSMQKKRAIDIPISVVLSPTTSRIPWYEFGIDLCILLQNLLFYSQVCDSI